MVNVLYVIAQPMEEEALENVSCVKLGQRIVRSVSEGMSFSAGDVKMDISWLDLMSVCCVGSISIIMRLAGVVGVVKRDV